MSFYVTRQLWMTDLFYKFKCVSVCVCVYMREGKKRERGCRASWDGSGFMPTLTKTSYLVTQQPQGELSFKEVCLFMFQFVSVFMVSDKLVTIIVNGRSVTKLFFLPKLLVLNVIKKFFLFGKAVKKYIFKN